MTPQRAKELLPVIQAYADGKQVEYRMAHVGRWCPATSGDAQFMDNLEYRIKKEPLVKWFVINDDDCVISAHDAPTKCYHPSNRVVKMQEVI